MMVTLKAAGKTGNFDKVITMIDDLTKAIKTEQQVMDAKVSECDKSLYENGQELKSNKAATDRAGAEKEAQETSADNARSEAQKFAEEKAQTESERKNMQLQEEAAEA